MRQYIGVLSLCIALALPFRTVARVPLQPRKIPILVYHSHRILGNTYETNDHIALYHDLRTIHAEGFHIVPLMWIVEWVLGQREEHPLHQSIAITFDDGADYDYYDINHPQYGPQRSFYNILRDFQIEVSSSAQPHLHASAFVIGSPRARREIAGLTGMTDAWWKEAQKSGMMSIYNHSWDHNHPAVRNVCEKSQRKGFFTAIDTYEECRCEVQQAAAYIHQKISPAWPDLFAYPWGQSSNYLKERCLPSLQSQYHTIAAFGASGGYVTKPASRWNLPRFVSGAAWRNTQELVHVLHGAQHP